MMLWNIGVDSCHPSHIKFTKMWHMRLVNRQGEGNKRTPGAPDQGSTAPKARLSIKSNHSKKPHSERIMPKHKNGRNRERVSPGARNATIKRSRTQSGTEPGANR